MSLTASGRYRLFAFSPSRPGFVIVEDTEAQHRLFIRKNGEITRKTLDPDLVAALVDHPDWRIVRDGHWYSIDELRRVQLPERRDHDLDEVVLLDVSGGDRTIEEWSD